MHVIMFFTQVSFALHLIVGDLKNGRTVHSLVKLLSLYQVTLNFVSPPSLAMPESVKLEASKAGIQWAEYASLDDVVGKSDVLYVTRVQRYVARFCITF